MCVILAVECSVVSTQCSDLVRSYVAAFSTLSSDTSWLRDRLAQEPSPGRKAGVRQAAV